MKSGVPALAYGLHFNRYSTPARALYFMNTDDLVALVQNLPTEDANEIGNNIHEIARRRYTWDHIGEAYFALLEDRQQKVKTCRVAQTQGWSRIKLAER